VCSSDLSNFVVYPAFAKSFSKLSDISFTMCCARAAGASAFGEAPPACAELASTIAALESNSKSVM
jgi:hypothetical protein